MSQDTKFVVDYPVLSNWFHITEWLTANLKPDDYCIKVVENETITESKVQVTFFREEDYIWFLLACV